MDDGGEMARIPINLLNVGSMIFAVRPPPCVVQTSNSGHQLLLPPANWCPIFASRTTHRLILPLSS